MSALGSFKLIACPKGNACPHPDCIFKHPRESTSLNSGTDGSPHQRPTSVATPGPFSPGEPQGTSDFPPPLHMTSDRPVSGSESGTLSDNITPISAVPPEQSPQVSENGLPSSSEGPQLTKYDPASPAWTGPKISSRDAVPLRSPSRPATLNSPAPVDKGPNPVDFTTQVGRNPHRNPNTTPQEMKTPPSRDVTPPLKRKLSTPDPPFSKFKKQATHSTPPVAKPVLSAPSTSLPTPRSSAAKSTPKPRKPEGLNPRLVTPAPASHEIRLRLLKLLHAEFSRLNTEFNKNATKNDKKLVLSDQELIWRALDEEERATSKGPVYTNVLKNRIMAYKRMSQAVWIEEQRKAAAEARGSSGTGQHKPNGKPVETGLAAMQEIQIARTILTPYELLGGHGYVPEIPAEKEVEKVRDGVIASRNTEHCDRCRQRFQVFPGRNHQGSLTNGGQCTYHPGKKYFPEQGSARNSTNARRYMCCHEDTGDSAGCTTASSHVFKAPDPKRLSIVLPFSKTPENPNVDDSLAFCFDCEMGYTVYGSELIRLTVVAWPTGKVALDVLVQPKGEIIDLNSRYSGVTLQDMTDAELWDDTTLPPVDESEVNETTRVRKGLKKVKSPEAARALFYSMINPKTILIGHGLENDLNACRMIHPTIIDTALLYPHARGLPFRNSLKILAFNHLQMKIQVDNGGQGHDSAEDARAAGELVRNKVKQKWVKMQVEGWEFVGGKLVRTPLNSAGTPNV